MNTSYQILQFMCRCATPLSNGSTVGNLRNVLVQDDFCWEPVIEMANAYFMTTSLWSGLISKGLGVFVNEEPRRYLHELHRMNRERNTCLRRQLIEAVGILNKAGIRPLLLKGSGMLAVPVHEDIGSRIMSDLDLLIPHEQMAHAVDALTSMGGYQEVEVRYDVHHFHHWAPLVRPGEYGPIELHRQTLHHSVAHVLPNETIWEKAKLFTLDGVDFYLPCPTHSIIIYILHCQDLSDIYDPRQLNPKALYALALIAKAYSKQIDWSMIHRLMKKNGLKYLAEAHLIAAKRLFGIRYPFAVAPGPVARVRYRLSVAAMDRSIVKRLSRRAHEFSRYRICKRYGCSQRFLPLTVYRIRYLLFYLRTRFEIKKNKKIQVKSSV